MKQGPRGLVLSISARVGGAGGCFHSGTLSTNKRNFPRTRYYARSKNCDQFGRVSAAYAPYVHSLAWGVEREIEGGGTKVLCPRSRSFPCASTHATLTLLCFSLSLLPLFSARERGREKRKADWNCGLERLARFLSFRRRPRPRLRPFGPSRCLAPSALRPHMAVEHKSKRKTGNRSPRMTRIF
jgi:hypothetical protein